MTAFRELGEIGPRRIWDEAVVRTVDGERLTLGVVELEPGSVVPEHRHDNEQLGMVLRGSLRFRVGGEERELGPGGTWSIPPDVPHDVRVGPAGAVVIDVFAPGRDDWAALSEDERREPLWP